MQNDTDRAFGINALGTRHVVEGRAISGRACVTGRRITCSTVARRSVSRMGPGEPLSYTARRRWPASASRSRRHDRAHVVVCGCTARNFVRTMLHLGEAAIPSMSHRPARLPHVYARPREMIRRLSSPDAGRVPLTNQGPPRVRVRARACSVPVATTRARTADRDVDFTPPRPAPRPACRCSTRCAAAPRPAATR